MRSSTITTLFFSAFLLMLWSCHKEAQTSPAVPHLPATPYAYHTNSTDKVATLIWEQGNVTISTNSNSPITIPGITENTVTLGQVIFHDNVITVNGLNNCSNCHNAPPRIITGPGITGEQGLTLHPDAGIEGGESLVAKMLRTSYYPQLFKKAFGTPEITTERISYALAQYMAAMATHSSPEALAADPRFSDPFK